jgi:hypothetical protein
MKKNDHLPESASLREFEDCLRNFTPKTRVEYDFAKPLQTNLLVVPDDSQHVQLKKSFRNSGQANSWIGGMVAGAAMGAAATFLTISLFNDSAKDPNDATDGTVALEQSQESSLSEMPAAVVKPSVQQMVLTTGTVWGRGLRNNGSKQPTMLNASSLLNDRKLMNSIVDVSSSLHDPSIDQMGQMQSFHSKWADLENIPGEKSQYQLRNKMLGLENDFDAGLSTFKFHF